ncbi:glycosyltransferase [Nostoc sp. 'Lobaria pulmonaria (5183) cyanobiont']|uniref:glycosyltransferase n=1 Tax=Nostoc sp. 'Lobaria pulmonaria (5183) cyanobiont' TaxID=1618022 RepID=UPI000CF3084B|nr:glycosyltransferase [Nostoc sp. 'Lobaria pulmonaria (5183) cyanobiont']AVH73817.1 sucrose-phosphate synthase [Nostoc sp. 'Lobaria pulmonaria (5183) cyanobiont']
MHIGFLNPQGNFDSGNSHITKHPDFGGQLIYVKQAAIAIAQMGHKVDILTRQIIDPEWPEFAQAIDTYPGVDNVRIIRLPAGPKEFLSKELLWTHLVTDWVSNILKFYQQEGSLPDAMTAHYADGGLCGVLIEEKTGIPFTFTAHSLGAQKMDKLEVTPENLTEIDKQFYFRYRILAERLSMNRSAINITSTRQERFEQYSHQVYNSAVDVDNDNRFAVIPPGADFSIFGAKVRSENEEASYQFVQDKLARDIAEARRDLPVILASSRLELKKNILGLVQAFAMSPTLQERANLVLITGALDNPLREEASDEMTEEVLAPIREAVKENDLWGKISAFGLPHQSQESLAATYRFMVKRRSVFALTALYEPFGLAPLEAAVAGLPVVATKNGGPSESLRQGNQEYGVLVDPEDPADIARGLERLLCDTQEWEYFAQAGQQRVLKTYTWESTAENYLSLLEQILSSPETRPRAELLPIYPYFHNPESQTDVSLEELSELYFGTNQKLLSTPSL